MQMPRFTAALYTALVRNGPNAVICIAPVGVTVFAWLELSTKRLFWATKEEVFVIAVNGAVDG